MRKLEGKVCLVAGASRGVGRGIAEGLGEAGAVVYVTGRSTRRGPRTEGRPETVEETAERVKALGGEGVAVSCDHMVEAEVAALVARIERERGRLDVLANNVWGGYERYDDVGWGTPFWEIPPERWDLMVGTGVEGKWRTARLAAPLLLRSERGLLVNVSSPVGTPYRGHLPYYVANHAVDRMTEAMAGDFRRHGVAVVSLQPGFTRTERVEEAYAADPAGRRKDQVDQTAHTPRYAGRAVVALARDPRVMERSGGIWPVGVLAREYGFTDLDGRQPQWPPEEEKGRKKKRKPEPAAVGAAPEGGEEPAWGRRRRKSRGRKKKKGKPAAEAAAARSSTPRKKKSRAKAAAAEPKTEPPPKKKRSRGKGRKKKGSPPPPKEAPKAEAGKKRRRRRGGRGRKR